MTHSMTGFARAQSKAPWGNVSCDIRSLNHRYLDLNFRLPESLRFIESELRSIAQQHLARGKVECVLHFDFNDAALLHLQINDALLKNLLQACQTIQRQGDALGAEMLPVDPLRLLSWPSMLKVEEQLSSAVMDTIRTVFKDAITTLQSERAREGSILGTHVLNCLQKIDVHVIEVRKQVPQVLEYQKKLLLDKFQEANLQHDPLSLEQALLMWSQKLDVAEELERLGAHIHEAMQVLKQTATPIGKRLEFLAQEMHRETNTLGVKLVSIETSRRVIEIKLLLEQIREQIHNIE